MLTTTLPVYRRSALQLVAEGCLFRFDKIYRQGVEDTSDLSLIGTGGHSVKYHYIQRLLAKQLPADGEEADEAFIEGIAVAQIPSRLIPAIREPWMRHTEVWELQLDRYVTSEEPQVQGQIGFTPDLVLANSERNELEIVDSKWGWDPPMTETELKSLFQARVYSRYAKDRWPNFGSYRFTIEAVRFNKYVSVVFSLAELDQVELEVRAAIATIEHAGQTGSYPAVAGPACRYCELACPVADQDVTYPKRLTPEQAQIAGAWLLTHRTKQQVVQKTLKAHVAGFGPVSVNGVVWDNRPLTERKYPIGIVMQFLQKRGLGQHNPMVDDSLTISQSALGKVFKLDPSLASDLEPYAQTKQVYRFGAKQAGEIEDGEE